MTKIDLLALEAETSSHLAQSFRATELEDERHLVRMGDENGFV